MFFLFVGYLLAAWGPQRSCAFRVDSGAWVVAREGAAPSGHAPVLAALGRDVAARMIHPAGRGLGLLRRLGRGSPRRSALQLTSRGCRAALRTGMLLRIGEASRRSPRGLVVCGAGRRSRRRSGSVGGAADGARGAAREEARRRSPVACADGRADTSSLLSLGPAAKADEAAAPCPICFRAPARPCRIRCGHTFCPECIEMWLRVSDACPLCRRAARPCRAFLSRVARGLREAIQDPGLDTPLALCFGMVTGLFGSALVVQCFRHILMPDVASLVAIVVLLLSFLVSARLAWVWISID